MDCLNGVSTLEHVLYYYCLLPHACVVRVAWFLLEVAFSVQKASSRLLNNAFYAALCCQIRMLPWRPGNSNQIRSRYIEAMETADQEDYRELIAFMEDLIE